MESYFSSMIWYLAAMAFAVLFARLSTIYKKEQRKFLILSFLVTFLFCALRFWVGNDYIGYYETFFASMNGDYDLTRAEPGYYFLNKIFSFTNYGFFFTLATASFITIAITYKVLVTKNCLIYGVFAYFTLGFLIMANDQVRQAIAVAIFLYALTYLEEGKYVKYILLIAVSTLFHYSAVIMILVVFLRKVHFSRITYFVALGAAYVVYMSQMLLPYVYAMFFLLPHYGEHYETGHDVLFEGGQATSGLGVLFNFVVLPAFAILHLKKNNMYFNIFIVGSIINLATNGFMFSDRITRYLIMTNVLVFPIIFSEKKHQFQKMAMVSLIVIYYSLQSLFALENHGAVPYRTLFFEENLDRPHYNYVDD